MPRPPSYTPDKESTNSYITAGGEDGHASVFPTAQWFQEMFEQQTAVLRSLAAEHHKALYEVLAQPHVSARLPASPSSWIHVTPSDRTRDSSEEVKEKPLAERSGMQPSSDDELQKQRSQRSLMRQSTADEVQTEWDERDRAKKIKRAKRERERERHEIERQNVPEERRGKVNASSLQHLVQDARFFASKSSFSCSNIFKVDTAQEFVDGPLDVITGWVIIVNAIALVMHAEWMGWQAEFALGLRDTTSLHWSAGFKVAEHVFTVIYIIELVFRLVVLRSRWLFTRTHRLNYTNMLDAAIIAVSAVDLYLLEHVLDVDSPSIALARLIRLARVARTFRVVRVMKMFGQLRILTATFIASLGALFWSMVILAIFMFLGALVICQSTHEFIMDDNNDLEMRLWVYEMYGSAGKAMYTFFEATNSGGWPNYARPLIKHISPWFILIFLVYVTIVIFGIIRIITAMFIKETLSVASSDATLAVQESLRIKESYRQKLQVVFEEADSSGDGVISRAELETALEKGIVLDYLSILEIEIHDVAPLFDLLDDGDGQVTIQEFCQGVTKLKGHARALDMVAVMHDTNVIMNQSRDIKLSLQNLEAVLGLTDPPITAET